MTKADHIRAEAYQAKRARGYLALLRQAGIELRAIETSKAQARAFRKFALSETYAAIQQYGEER